MSRNFFVLESYLTITDMCVVFLSAMANQRH